jgi:hypothetical protein
MRTASKLVVVLAVIAIGILFTLGRGPVGPESVVGTEVQERVEKAAVRAEATISPYEAAGPQLLKLPSGLERKRQLKRMLSAVGLMSSAPETAMQFTLREQRGLQFIRCLVVLRGDHVIGLAVIQDTDDHAFADRAQSELEREFPEYEVQRLP